MLLMAYISIYFTWIDVNRNSCVVFSVYPHWGVGFTWSLYTGR